MLSEGKLFIWFHPESGKSRPRLFSLFTFSLPAPRGTSAAALAREEINKVIGSPSPPPAVGGFVGSQIKLCAAVVDALSGSEGFPFGERR